MTVDPRSDTAEKTVFISYARSSAQHEATQLHQMLADDGIDAFLDTNELAAGDELAEGILDAALAARVMVIFLDSVYLTRWYCVRELMVAAEAARVLIDSGVEAGNPELAAAQRAFVIAVGAEVGQTEMDHLPPLVGRRNWPRAVDTARLAALIREAIRETRETIGQRLERLGAVSALRRRMAHELELPPPADLRHTPVYHETGLPDSIRDAFVGREALMWELHTILKTQRTGPSVAALTGAIQGGAGFGKTRLALEYLHRYGPRHYPGGLFWVNADVPDDRLQAQLHGILCLLEPGTPELRTMRQNGLRVEDELRRALAARPSERGVLYVVDNVPEPAPGEPPSALWKWCPARGLVTLLVTSRTSVAVGEPMVWNIRMGVLPPSATVDALTYGYADRGRMDESKWHRIADWVGRLPLALTILNGSLRQRALSALELAELAEQQDGESLAAVERQVEALRPLVPAGQLGGIADALQISYQRLQPEAQRAARLLARLGPDPIPLAVLQAFGEGMFSPAVRAALVTRSFVTEVPGTPVETFGSMHRLLAEFLRGTGGDGAAETQLASEALAKVTSWDACKDPQRWLLLDACRPHAERLFRHGIDGAPDLQSEPVLTLGANLGYLLRMQGHYRESAEIRGRVLEIAMAVLGDQHPRTLKAMADLAATLRRQGELNRSQELAEQVVEMSVRILGPEDSVTLSAKATLAATLRDQREFRRSRDLAEQVLTVNSRRWGDEHVDTLVSMGNLAATLRRLGDLQRARDLEERLLATRRLRDGDEHPETLTAMANLATTLRGQAELGRARRLQEQVLDVRRRLLGPQHSDTLRALDNLAATLRSQGEVKEAEQLEALIPEERRTWHD